MGFRSHIFYFHYHVVLRVGLQFKRQAFHGRAIFGDGAIERVVDRALDDDVLAWFDKGAYQQIERLHNPMRDAQPAGVDRPVVARGIPRGNRLAVGPG